MMSGQTSDERHTDCDGGGIDDLACRAKGIQRRAEVTNESLAELQEFKTRFATARADYGSARETAAPDIAAAEDQLKAVREQLRCHIGEEDRRHLWHALTKVLQDIEKCAGRPGCCVQDCRFDEPADDEHDGDHDGDKVGRLAGLIERYRRDTKKASDCFRSLAAERTKLPERAATIRKDLDQLAADVAADVKHKELIRHWARLLVARNDLKQVWNGFSTINAYVDCLCKALEHALKGWQAVAHLEGLKATLECREVAEAAACQRKRDNTVDEVLAEYERVCPSSDRRQQTVDDDGW
jgi:hypothetical protein